METSLRAKHASRRRRVVGAAVLPILAAAILSAHSARHADTPQPQPDLILHHGKILTVDSHDSIVEALAISGGKIIAVGTNAQIQPLATSATRVIDLHGRTATPGLIDTHGHFADGSASELFGVTLSDASSIDEILRRVRTRAATLKARRMAYRQRLGRRQAQRPSLRLRLRSRQGRAAKSRLAAPHHRPLRRRQYRGPQTRAHIRRDEKSHRRARSIATQVMLPQASSKNPQWIWSPI